MCFSLLPKLSSLLSISSFSLDQSTTALKKNAQCKSSSSRPLLAVICVLFQPSAVGPPLSWSVGSAQRLQKRLCQFPWKWQDYIMLYYLQHCVKFAFFHSIMTILFHVQFVAREVMKQKEVLEGECLAFQDFKAYYQLGLMILLSSLVKQVLHACFLQM